MTRSTRSRDAGLSWQEVAKGSFIYEMGDHGGLVVMAANGMKTSHFMYSWNEGLNWTRTRLAETAFEVENVITHPGGASQLFLAYGETEGKGVVVQLDFSALHPAQCKNIDAPWLADSDYEQWTPADSLREGACLLGSKSTFVRRKREAKCWNGPANSRREFKTYCQCNDNDDFECDYGFMPKINEPSVCVPDPDAETALVGVPPAQCVDVWFKTKGYRKVPGDHCEGITMKSPDRTPCPRNSNVAVVILLVLLILIVGGAGFLYTKRHDGITLFGKHIDFGPNYAFFPLNNNKLVDDDDDFGLGGDDDGEAMELGDHTILDYAKGSRGGQRGDDFDPRV
jgi:hypothetical protein